MRERELIVNIVLREICGRVCQQLLVQIRSMKTNSLVSIVNSLWIYPSLSFHACADNGTQVHCALHQPLDRSLHFSDALSAKRQDASVVNNCMYTVQKIQRGQNAPTRVQLWG
jgi:hypothetical protein